MGVLAVRHREPSVGALVARSRVPLGLVVDEGVAEQGVQTIGGSFGLLLLSPARLVFFFEHIGAASAVAIKLGGQLAGLSQGTTIGGVRFAVGEIDAPQRQPGRPSGPHDIVRLGLTCTTKYEPAYRFLGNCFTLSMSETYLSVIRHGGVASFGNGYSRLLASALRTISSAPSFSFERESVDSFWARFGRASSRENH